MLTTLLLKTNGVANLSEEAIVDNLKTFFFGGFDTTAITLSYALFSLSQAPEWTQRILEEVPPHTPQPQWRPLLLLAGWMDGWMDSWMAGWMDGWMGGWMDG